MISSLVNKHINELLNNNKNENKDTIVLSSGSIRGIAHLGALHYLFKVNILSMDNIKNISGSSAGSMVGLMLIIGYKPFELFKIMKLIDIKKTQSNGNFQNILTKLGLNDGNKIMTVIKELMIAKNYDVNVTFKQLYMLSGIHFFINGVNVNDKELIYFSHITYPNMRVIDAIRISSSIPLLFTPVTKNGKLFVDGGCIDNYPISPFNDSLNNVIGLYIISKINKINKIRCIEEYLIHVVQCLCKSYDDNVLRGYKNNTIIIDCGDYNDTPTGIINLFDKGYSSAKSFHKNIHTHNNCNDHGNNVDHND